MQHQQIRATPPGAVDKTCLTAPQSGSRCHTHSKVEVLSGALTGSSPCRKYFFFFFKKVPSHRPLWLRFVINKCLKTAPGKCGVLDTNCPSHLRHFCFLCSKNKKAKTGSPRLRIRGAFSLKGVRSNQWRSNLNSSFMCSFQ